MDLGKKQSSRLLPRIFSREQAVHCAVLGHPHRPKSCPKQPQPNHQYLLLNVKQRNSVQMCHFLCWNCILAAPLSPPVRTSSCWDSEWVYCGSKLLGEAEQGRFRKKKEGKKTSSHTSHMNSFFFWSYWMSEEKLQIVNLRSLPSRKYPYLSPDCSADSGAAGMGSLLFLLLCGSYGRTKPGQMICLRIHQPKNSDSCNIKPLQ